MNFADIATATLVAAVWGFNFLMIKAGLAEMPPFLFGALRFAVAALPLLAAPQMLRGPWRGAVRYGLLLGVANFGLLFWGMKMGMSAGLSSLVLQSQAFFTALLAWGVLKIRPTRDQWLGLAVAMIGLVVIGMARGGTATTASFVIVVAASFFWGAANIAMKKSAPADPFRFLLKASLVSVLPLFALSLVFEGPAAIQQAIVHVSYRGIGGLLYVAIVSTLLGFGLWCRLLQKYSPNVIAPYTLLVPVFGMAFATWIAHEHFAPGEWLGGVILVVALVFTSARKPAAAALRAIGKSPAAFRAMRERERAREQLRRRPAAI